MKALVLIEQGKLVMMDMPKPKPGPNEVLIRTQAATICTSDLQDIKENSFGMVLPMIMGHEGSGIVEEIGQEVTDFVPGDAVCTHPVIPCYQCESCRRGLSHLCDKMSHLGIDKGGVFAEYFVIRQDRARKKPECLDFAAATLMEPVCVCLEALQRAQVSEGKRVLILGDGPFGIMMSRLCRRYSPKQIIVLGRHSFRMNYAGAEVTVINEKTVSDPLEEIMKLSENEGVDSAVLCVGTNEALDLAVSALRSRGCLSVFSAVTGNPVVDMFKVHVKELSLAGSCNDEDMIDEALSFLCDENLALPELITHRLPFGEFEKAFALAEKGKDEALKVSLLF